MDAFDKEGLELRSDRPFIEGFNSDECEEEIEDDGLELEAYYQSKPDEYETDEQFAEELATTLDDDEEGETDFEGFSDHDVIDLTSDDD